MLDELVVAPKVVTKTVGELPHDLRKRLIHEAIIENDRGNAKTWDQYSETPLGATRLDILGHLVTNPASLVTDVLRYTVETTGAPFELYVSDELFMGLCDGIGVIDYPDAFGSMSVMGQAGITTSPFGGYRRAPERIIQLASTLTTPETSGWDKLVDDGFMRAYVACVPQGYDGCSLQYLIRLDSERGLAVYASVPLNQFWPRYIQHECGLDLREVSTNSVHLPVSEAPNQVRDKEYRQRAKCLMIRSGHAEVANLPDGRRLVAREFLDHPRILASTKGTATGKTFWDIETCWENIPV